MRIERLAGSDSVERSRLQEFAQLLLTIGDGTLPSLENNIVKLPAEWFHYTVDTSHIVNIAYPELSSPHDRSYFVDRAILAPRNEDVDLINAKACETFPGDAQNTSR